ncbi:MAG: hypothetical protein M0013_12330 [Actinomycetota bacterium]|nr:hypothetical protein [Actinomycetota bacterium]
MSEALTVVARVEVAERLLDEAGDVFEHPTVVGGEIVDVERLRFVAERPPSDLTY